MKIVNNTNNDTIFSHFHEIDESSNQWSLDNPCIFFNKKNSQNSIYMPDFVNLTQQPKYLLVKFFHGITYTISNRNNACFNVYFYDFLESLNSDIQNGVGYFKHGLIGYQNSKTNTIQIKFEYPKLVLMALTPYNASQLSYSNQVYLQISKPTEEILTKEHFVRNWQDKVKGIDWNVSGKINTLKNLKQTERRIKNNLNELFPLKQGINLSYYNWYPDYGNSNFYVNSFEQFQNFLKNKPTKQTIIEEASFNGNIIEYTSKVIAKMNFWLYIQKDGQYEFRFNRSGQVGFQIDKNKNYMSSDEITIYLEEGFHDVTIYYNSYYSSISFQFLWKQYQNYKDVPSYLFYLKNEIDIDKYISYQNIFNKAVYQAFSDGYMSFDQDSSSYLNYQNVFDKCTLSFWLRFDDIYSTDRYPYTVITGQNYVINIKRISNDTLQISSVYLQSPIIYKFNRYEQNHIVLTISKNLFSWYFNVNNNGFQIINKINEEIEIDSNYIIGKFNNVSSSGNFFIYNFIFFSQILKQNQINRLYLNAP